MSDKKRQRVKIQDQEEAIEDRDLLLRENDDNQFGKEDAKIKGDYLHEHEHKDYNNIEQLDRYDEQLLDNQEYENMSFEAKRKADQKIAQRQKMQKRLQNKDFNRRPELLYRDQESEISIDQEDLDYRRKEQFDEEFYQENIDDEDGRFQPENVRGKLQELINQKSTVNYIKKKFYLFLTTFTNSQNKQIYINKIHQMCKENKQSILVDYQDLSNSVQTIAYWIFETPSLILGFLNNVVMEVACKMYPGYNSIQQEIYVKIENFPLEEKIRELRIFHLNTMIQIKGVVTRKYPIYQTLKKIFYVCTRCSFRFGPIYQQDEVDLKLGNCTGCQQGNKFKISLEDRVYGNHQKIIVQESPQTVPPGRVPRSKEVYLLGDNIDIARPGDEVQIVGIYKSRYDQRMNEKHGFPIFSTYIEGNNVKEVKQIESTQITDFDKQKIKEVSKQPHLFEKIYNSIAPSIYGHNDIKKALTMALFGGVPIKRETHQIRGDINILLMGDPGLGKSQFLKYIQNVSHRSVYTTGKGASAVGLTASVKKDPMTNEWCLEGGALVLADTGICLIDEFDKMNDQDRTSIHEAMEQQSISISKAGIVATLKARCSVIAAANPFKGTYDDKLSFKENVDLSDTILSRFDILCVLKDNFDICRDEKLADFLIDSHINNHPDLIEEIEEQENNDLNTAQQIYYKNGFTQQFLKKYILYAKKHHNFPQLDQKCSTKLQEFYVKLRQESRKTSGLNIVVRHLESLIRIAQASAKMHLRNYVSLRDCDIAISILLNSFIGSLKPSVSIILKKRFMQYVAKSTSQSSKLAHILNELMNKELMYRNIKQNNLEEEKMLKVRMADLKAKATENQITKIDKFLKSEFFLNGFQIIDMEHEGVTEQYIVKEV